MIDFMTSSQDNEEMLWKKDCSCTACDVTLCTGLVKDTRRDHNNISSRLIKTSLGSNVQFALNDTKKFINPTREQTIATNEGVLECGNLPPKCLFLFNCLENIF